MQRNVLGGALRACSAGRGPTTGWTRSGACEAHASDGGRHHVCARMTSAFLAFSAARGNDLVTARGSFVGLREGDEWCLCAGRWLEAAAAAAAGEAADDVVPPVVLEATAEAALEVIPRELLEAHAVDD